MAVFVHEAKIELPIGISLRGRFAVPTHRLAIIPSDALAILVHDPEIVLRDRIPLLGRLAIPAHRLGMITWRTLAILIGISQIHLSGGISSHGLLEQGALLRA